MLYPNLFKRIVPFVLALGLGLFIASFFVELTPSFRSRRGKFHQMKRDYAQLKIDNERLKAENEELKKDQGKCEHLDFKYYDLLKREEEMDSLPPEAKKKLERQLEEDIRKERERLEK